MGTRYVAEWISGYDGPDDPDSFSPDCYVYTRKVCRSREEAERMAETESEKAGVCGGWWSVEEQQYDPDYYEPGVGDWETIRAWIEGQEVGV